MESGFVKINIILPMEQRLSFISLGVNDLQVSKAFYMEKLGWTPIKDDQGIVFFKLNGFILSLFGADELAKDIGINSAGNGFRKFTLATNFNSVNEVDECFKELERKGVNIVLAPEEVYWGGYRGYFSDPDGNYWEVAYNPFLEMDESGYVLNHQ